MAKPLQHWWVRCLAVFGIWTSLGLVDAGQTYFYHANHDDPVPLSSALVLGVLDWYVWAALTPFIVWLALRFPLDHPSWRRVLLHAAASVCTALLVITLAVPLLRVIPHALHKPMTDQELFYLLLASKLIFYVITHWLVLGVTHGLIYYGRYKDRELRASQLEGQLARTQLQMLKGQLHPHFLFNTLHAISALIHKDVELADRMIARLGELLRITLDNAGRQEVPLRQEVAFIEPYLEIEKARLGPRLEVRMEIDPAALDAQVPNLLLLPLVENAVKHGIAPKPGPGVIEVRGRREGAGLRLEVRDTGQGLPACDGEPLKEGVGLGNTRARLRHLYGDRQELKIENGPGDGVIVRVALPFAECLSGPKGADAPPNLLGEVGDSLPLLPTGLPDDGAGQDADRGRRAARPRALADPAGGA